MNLDDQTPDPEHLLIIHPGALGDVVAMFGLIAGLNHRNHRTTLVCRESVGRLAMDLKLADRFFSMEAACWATLYNRRPDHRALQLLAEHHQILLFTVNAELEQIINSWVSVPCLRVPPRPPAKTSIHVTRFAAEVLVANGFLDQIPSSRTAVCRQAPPEVQIPADKKRPPVLLHPGAGSQRKRWPVSAFLAVAARISAAGGIPELIVGPADRDLLALTRSAGLSTHVLDEIPELLLLLKTAAGFIGNDSGVAHLAACLGLPTTVIFTVSDPRRWRPNGPSVAALAPSLPCRPCFETQAENCPQPECLTAITPDTVWQTFSSLCRAQEVK